MSVAAPVRSPRPAWLLGGSLPPGRPALHSGLFMPKSPAPLAAPRRPPPHRIPHLPRQPPLRRPGCLQPSPDARTDRARTFRHDVRGPALARRRRRRSRSKKSPGSTSTGARTPSASRGPTSSAPSTTSRNSGSCAPPGSPSPTRSAAASTRCCATAATSSTSCTTTSASVRGLLGLMRDGWPFVNTLHHPITVDRDLDLAAASGPFRRATLRRWYGFLRHADARRVRGPASHHGVGELEEGHRRADGRRSRHVARRAGRRRSAAVPARSRTSRAFPGD